MAPEGRPLSRSRLTLRAARAARHGPGPGGKVPGGTGWRGRHGNSGPAAAAPAAPRTSLRRTRISTGAWHHEHSWMNLLDGGSRLRTGGGPGGVPAGGSQRQRSLGKGQVGGELAAAEPDHSPVLVWYCAAGSSVLAPARHPSDHMPREKSDELDRQNEHPHRQPQNSYQSKSAPKPGFIGVVSARRRGPQEQPLIPPALINTPAAVRVTCQRAPVVRQHDRCYR